jgi:hypothetical protein
LIKSFLNSVRKARGSLGNGGKLEFSILLIISGLGYFLVIFSLFLEKISWIGEASNVPTYSQHNSLHISVEISSQKGWIVPTNISKLWELQFYFILTNIYLPTPQLIFPIGKTGKTFLSSIIILFFWQKALKVLIE